MKHLNNFRKVLLSVLVLLGCCASAMAQSLNGTYTVGGTTPDFPTVADACVAVSGGGVSGPVVFNIRPGTYAAATIGLTGTGVAGTSATNTITFQPDPANPGTVTISTTGGFAFLIQDADYVTVKNLAMANTGTATTARVLNFAGAATNNRIENCTLTGRAIASTGTGYCVIYSDAAGAINNTLIGNTIKNGSYAVYIAGGSTTSLKNGWVINNNTITDAYGYGIYAIYMNNLKMNGNNITKAGAGSYYGLYPYYTYGKTEARNNTINISGVNSTAAGIYGMYCVGDAANYCAFTGNTINVAGSSSSYGIYNNYGNYDSIANNIVTVNNTAGTVYPLYNYNSNGNWSATAGNYMITTGNTFNSTSTGSTGTQFYGGYFFKNTIMTNNNINIKGGTGSGSFYTNMYYGDSSVFSNNTVYDSVGSTMTIYSAYGNSTYKINKAEQKNNIYRFISQSSSISTAYFGYYADNMDMSNNDIYMWASGTVGTSIWFAGYCNDNIFNNNKIYAKSNTSYVYWYIHYYSSGYLNNNTMEASSAATYCMLYNSYYSGTRQYNNNKITINGGGTSYAYHYSMYQPSVAGWEMIGNEVNLNMNSPSSTCMGLYMYDYNGTGPNGIVANNKVKVERLGSGTGAFYGAYIYYPSSLKIYNNTFWVNGGGTNYTAYIAYPKGPVDFYNNVVHTHSPGSANNFGLYYVNDATNGGGLFTSRNNVYSRSNASGTSLYMNNLSFYQGDYNNIYAPSGGLSNQGATIAALRNNGIERNSLSYDPGFINPAAADVRPDPANPNSWSLQGRGVQIPGNNKDIVGNTRSILTSTGVPDIGAYEFTPTVPAPLCTILPAAPITAPGTQYALFGGDTVLSIDYAAGSAVPDPANLMVKQYTGVMPPDAFTSFNSTFMYFYDSVNVANTTGTFNYNIKNYYKEPWLGTIASESSLRLAKKTIPGTWGAFASAISNANTTRNFIQTTPTPTGLSNFGYYTGVDVSNNAGAGLIASPTGTFCPGVYPVSIYVKNNGNNVINSVKLDWQTITPVVGPVTTISITTPIPVNNGTPGSNQIAVPLGNLTIGNGPTIKAWTHTPNNVTDPVPLDDTMVIKLHAAFNGTYIIDISNGAGTDYTSFVEAMNDLNQYGLCGPTTFRIKPGTYTGRAEILNVPGSNVNNRVTIMADNGSAASVTIVGAATDGFTLKMREASYYTLKNLTINAPTTTTTALEWNGKMMKDSVIGCTISNPGSLANSNSRTFWYTHSGNLDVADAAVFQNNTFSGGYYTYYFYNSSVGQTYRGLVFENNTINNAYYMSAYLGTHTMFKFNRNTINTSSANAYYGFYLYNYYAGQTNVAEGPFEIIGNKILNHQTGYGMYLVYPQGYNQGSTNSPVPGTVRSKIVNNVIAQKSGQSAMMMQYFGKTDIWNNTIFAEGSMAYTFYLYNSLAWNTGMDMRNNVFRHDGTASNGVFYMYLQGSDNLFDYNAIHYTATSGTWAYHNTTYTSLAAYRAGMANLGFQKNSIFNDPGLGGFSNPMPNPTNPMSWTLNGRGVHISGNDRDINGNPRVTQRKDGTPDIGAVEFEPTVQPPLCTAVPATAVPGTTQTFMFGTDTVAKITWNPALLFTSALEVRRYSGRVGNNFKNQVSNDRFMYFHTDINPKNGTTFNYDIDLYYRNIWNGTIQKEHELIAAQKVSTFPWLVYGFGSSTSDTTSKYIHANGLVSFGSFTGIDTPSVVSAIIYPASSTIICTGNSVLLQANSIPGAQYQWYQVGAGTNGADAPVGTNQNTYLATAGGDYYVVITAGPTQARSVNISVSVIPPPMALVTSSGPLTYCIGSNLKLSTPNQPGLRYQWQVDGADVLTDGDKNVFDVKQSGTYTVKVSNAGCTTTSTGTVINAGPLQVDLGNDIAGCEQANIPYVLDAGNPGAKYTWGIVGQGSLNDTTQTLAISNGTAKYWVRVDAGPGCLDVDTIDVNIKPLPSANGVSVTYDGSTNTYQPEVVGGKNVNSVLWVFDDEGHITTSTQNPPPPQTFKSSIKGYVVLINDCGRDTITFVQWATSVNNVNKSDFEVTLYPNPAKEDVTMSVTGNVTISEVTILNAIGEVVYRESVADVKRHTIALPQFAAGRYLVRATTTAGTITKPLNIVR